MSGLNIVLSLLVIGFLPHQEVTDHIPLASLDEDEQIENHIFERMDGSGLHGAVFMIENDGEVTEAAAGSLETDTPFSIASVTKMFTAAVIFQMIEDGLLAMDDTIDMYLTPGEYSGLHVLEGTEYSATLTISQLMGHTTGLPAYAESEAEGLTLVEESLDNGGAFTIDTMTTTSTPTAHPFTTG